MPTKAPLLLNGYISAQAFVPKQMVEVKSHVG